MKVVIHRSGLHSVVYTNVITTYTDGPLYCVLFTDQEGQRAVHKFPISSISKIVEGHPVREEDDD